MTDLRAKQDEDEKEQVTRVDRQPEQEGRPTAAQNEAVREALQKLVMGIGMLKVLQTEHAQAATYNEAIDLAAGYVRSFIGREVYLRPVAEQLALEAAQAPSSAAWNRLEDAIVSGRYNEADDTMVWNADTYRRLAETFSAVKDMREALRGLLGYVDDPTPYDANTTRAAARNALAKADAAVQGEA